MSQRTILTLVRHGETTANTQSIWDGSMDSPLTERGKLQASVVAQHIAHRFADAVALYASPLQRARHTAEAIGGRTGLPVRTEPGIAEYDLGAWEGKPYKELFEEHGLWQKIRDDPDFAPHGGESPRQVVDRYTDALTRIESSHPGQRAILVIHGGALALALGKLLTGKQGEWYKPVANCSVSEIVLSPKLEVLSFNVVDHLDGI